MQNRCNATEFSILKKDSYNISLWLKYQNRATVVRVLQPSAFFCPEEEVVNEVSVMRFLTNQTSMDEDRLEMQYGLLAGILLQLYTPLSRIG